MSSYGTKLRKNWRQCWVIFKIFGSTPHSCGTKLALQPFTQCWTTTTTATTLAGAAPHSGGTKLVARVQVATRVQVEECMEV